MTTNFPVTNSTLSADKLAEVVQEKYNFSTSTECKLFRTGMNHVYLVTDGSNKYVFRVYTFNWRTKIEIAEELRLLNYLNENNASVSYPIADNMNEFIQEFNAPEGKRYGVLFSFADGWKSAKFDAETSYSIGNALAKVHHQTENYSLNRITYNNEVLLVDSLKIIKEFFGKETEEIKFLERISDYLEVEFNNFDKNKIRFGAVHLDVWFDNLHFNKENKVTFF